MRTSKENREKRFGFFLDFKKGSALMLIGAGRQQQHQS